MKVSFR